MKFDHFLITGTSRGIGEALVRQLLGPDTRLYCISRNQNPRIEVEAKVKGFHLEDIALDLAELSRIRDVVRDIFRSINIEEVRSLYLINNAGIIHPIRKIGDAECYEQVIRAVSVNLQAAMLVTDVFMRESKEWDVPCRIMNLSTGAAKRPVHGWSAYCSSKAGLDMFTRCVAEEQLGDNNPVKIVAFAPGVVDTEMQSEIRNSDPESFKEHGRFVEMKEKGALLDPYTVAGKMKEVLYSESFGDELFMDVRDLL